MCAYIHRKKNKANIQPSRPNKLGNRVLENGDLLQQWRIFSCGTQWDCIILSGQDGTTLPSQLANHSKIFSCFLLTEKAECIIKWHSHMVLNTIIITHQTHYHFSDWPKVLREFSKSAPVTS